MNAQFLTRLRELRAARSLTQTQVARVLGVSQRTYSDYERGRLPMRGSHLIRLAALYGVSADYLCGITEDPKPYAGS